ncbi:MAG: flagellar assembly protein FliW [Alphaproteobacteria bacterium]|nr:flagellar assembly protein FliW [Alphaproteobacteria bacterium]
MDNGSSLAELTADVELEVSYPLEEAGHGQIADTDQLVIENRWGRFVFDRKNAIATPKGLPGFPAARAFALANLPDPRLEQFKLLQNLEDPDLSFLVAPLNMEASLLAPQDIADALEELEIRKDDAALLAIVTVRRDLNDSVLVTANMRAPLVIDTAARVGIQHIFTNEDYPIRFPLNLAA